MIALITMAGVLVVAAWLGRRRGVRVIARDPAVTVDSAHRHLPEIRVLFPLCVLFSILAVAVFSRYQLVWLLPAQLDGGALPLLFTCSIGFLAYITTATLAIAWRSAHRERRPMTFAAVALLAAFGFIYGRHGLPVHRGLQDERTGDGAILQTSPYTCGPAAAASLLALRGIETNEREMARLAGTTDLGTSPGGILRCLLCKGLAAHKARLTLADLRASPAPAILLVDHPGMGALSHAIVLERIEGGTAHVIDPLSGRVRMDVDQLQRQWRGHAICTTEGGRGPS